MDATAANIDVSYEDFRRKLAASLVVAEDELERVAAGTTGDTLGSAKALLESGLLTDYQLDAISQGRQSELRVGNYDILARLGAGGMGTVFLSFTHNFFVQFEAEADVGESGEAAPED